MEIVTLCQFCYLLFDIHVIFIIAYASMKKCKGRGKKVERVVMN